jgi:PAS domain S-box-containing protein
MRNDSLVESVPRDDATQQKTTAFEAEVRRRERAEERLEAELADAKLLQSVSAELISEKDVGAIYEKLVDAAVGIMRSDFASMQMFYPEKGPGGALRLLASRGFSLEARRCWEWVSQQTASSCGEVLRSGRRVVATDVERCEFLIRLGGLDAYLGAGIRAMQSTPLISRSGKLVGMISTHWRRPHEPSERDLRVFDLLVRQAADLLERTHAEQRLRESEARLAADLDAMTRLYELGNQCAQGHKSRAECLGAIVDAAIELSGADKGAIQLFDEDSGALVIEAQRGFGPRFLEFFGRGRPESASACSMALKTGRRALAEDITTNEHFVNQPALSILLAEGIRAVQSTPLISSAGKVRGVISTHFAQVHRPSERELRMLDLLARQAGDYLQRIEAARKLRASEERYHDLFESIDQGFCTIEVLFDDAGAAVDYRFLLVNPTFERQTGLSGAGGRRMREITRQYEERWFEIYGRVALTGEACRFEYEAKDLGRHYEVYAWRIGEPHERKVGVLFNDVTDRRRAAESEGRLAAIVEHSSDAILSIDLDAKILSWNQGAERLYGYTRAEAVGRHVSMLIPENRENEEPQILARIGRSETVKHYETVRRRKDGTLIDVSLTVSPLKDSSGRVVGASKVARDITERVRARETLEQTVSERTARLRETVSELEAFSYSIAHDMRAPLRAMNGYACFLQKDFGEELPPTAQYFLSRISQGASRLDGLITDVLNYSKIARGEMPLEKVDVGKLTQDIVDTYPNLRATGATITIESPIPPVLGNTAALTQCISNLLSNAVKFVSPGTTAQVRVFGEMRGERVRYSVADNGIGIDAEGRQRIFRLFQRLNLAAEFEGTGIGLTIVRKAVERMNGQVGVDSTRGAGSVFWIELPFAQ